MQHVNMNSFKIPTNMSYQCWHQYFSYFVGLTQACKPVMHWPHCHMLKGACSCRNASMLLQYNHSRDVMWCSGVQTEETSLLFGGSNKVGPLGIVVLVVVVICLTTSAGFCLMMHRRARKENRRSFQHEVCAWPTCPWSCAHCWGLCSTCNSAHHHGIVLDASSITACVSSDFVLTALVTMCLGVTKD